MSLALAGVGAALIWVTVTAALGFLANLSSPIGALRDFGIVSAFGVIAALIVYGTLIPALKIEIDGFLESRGFDRQKRAFATGGGPFSRLLVGGVVAARRFPVVVVVVALLLAVGGGYGATQVDTSFDETDFLADSPPEWTQSLPGAMAPGSYDVSEDIEFIGDNYQQQGSQADVLIRGDITDEQTLRWLADIQTETADQQTVFVGPNGPSIQSPLTAMQATAARGEQISATTMPAERTERQAATVRFTEEYRDAAAQDEVPTGNIAQLYDLLLQANPSASNFIHRTEEGYQAIRLQFGIVGNAGNGPVADDTRAVADVVTSESGGALRATPASDQVVFDNVQSDLLSTVTQGLIITLVSVFGFLSLAYRVTGRPASLGFVTMIPVMLAVTWILGSMWVLSIPFNTLTGTITSLTVGLGIAYSIHISSRYELELRRQGDVWKAMRTTVTGTGGALLGSAATTVGGFGTLAIAILPILQQFGIITGLTIVYAFLASVFVLPSLLALWTRYFGPAAYFPDEETSQNEQAVGDEQPTADGGEDMS
jgi:predicted RND superfamily exporter protein